MRKSKDERKRDIAYALLEKQLSPQQAIAQLRDLGWTLEDATDYINSLLGDV
jgi:hypothetical protein